MKNYSREEIEKIVSDATDRTIDKNIQNFIDEVVSSVDGKSNSQALIEVITLLYKASYENSKNIISQSLYSIFSNSSET